MIKSKRKREQEEQEQAQEREAIWSHSVELLKQPEQPEPAEETWEIDYSWIEIDEP